MAPQQSTIIRSAAYHIGLPLNASLFMICVWCFFGQALLSRLLFTNIDNSVFRLLLYLRIVRQNVNKVALSFVARTPMYHCDLKPACVLATQLSWCRMAAAKEKPLIYMNTALFFTWLACNYSYGCSASVVAIFSQWYHCVGHTLLQLLSI